MDEIFTLVIVFLFWCVAMAPLLHGSGDWAWIKAKWAAWRKRVQEDRDRWVE